MTSAPLRASYLSSILPAARLSAVLTCGQTSAHPPAPRTLQPDTCRRPAERARNINSAGICHRTSCYCTAVTGETGSLQSARCCGAPIDLHVASAIINTLEDQPTTRRMSENDNSAIFPPFLRRQHSGCRGAAAKRESETGGGEGGTHKTLGEHYCVYSNTDPDRDKEMTENAHENDPYSAEEMINEAKRTRQGA